eukprot:792142_1
MSEQQTEEQSTIETASNTNRIPNTQIPQIPQMPVDPNHPNAPPPPHGQPMMVLNRLTPIHGTPQFIIPQHPSHPSGPPYHSHPHPHPHGSFPPPPPPHDTQQTNGQSIHNRPPPHGHGHGGPHGPPHGPPSFYTPGITHIPVTQVTRVGGAHGLPPNVLLTPIHGPPPPHPTQNVRFIGSNFNVPPVQTIYSTNNNNNNNNNASKTPPIAEQKNDNNMNTLNNIRSRELLPINRNNNIYANSQQIASSNPNQNVLPHV